VVTTPGPADARMHGADGLPSDLARHVAEYVAQRSAAAPLGRTGHPGEFGAGLSAITADGIGPAAAWTLFQDVVAPPNVGLDSERFLAFIPAAPTPVSVWMDAVVSASSFSAESSLEAAGAVAAENEVLRWLCDLVGFPAGAGGCFLSGGTIGNLSALAVGRSVAGGRAVVVVADTAHASIDNALRLMGLTPLVVETDEHGRLTGGAVAEAVAGRRDVGIVVASGGSTNAGVVDDLERNLDEAQTLGHQYLVVASLPITGPRTLDDYRRWADRLNEAGRRARPRGVWIGFHNHGNDMTPIEGVVPYDILMERTDATLVRHQLDTGNTAMGGKDPLEYMRRYGPRYWSFHIKDVARIGATSDTELGKGMIDFRQLMAAIDNIDEKFLFVEQETYPGAPVDSLRRDYAYISTLEF